jgi:ribosomal protein L37AE/L43A
MLKLMRGWLGFLWGTRTRRVPTDARIEPLADAYRCPNCRQTFAVRKGKRGSIICPHCERIVRVGPT